MFRSNNFFMKKKKHRNKTFNSLLGKKKRWDEHEKKVKSERDDEWKKVVQSTHTKLFSLFFCLCCHWVVGKTLIFRSTQAHILANRAENDPNFAICRQFFLRVSFNSLLFSFLFAIHRCYIVCVCVWLQWVWALCYSSRVDQIKLKAHTTAIRLVQIRLSHHNVFIDRKLHDRIDSHFFFVIFCLLVHSIYVVWYCLFIHAITLYTLAFFVEIETSLRVNVSGFFPENMKHTLTKNEKEKIPS